jgi:H+/Cl- antiporter ClcA
VLPVAGWALAFGWQNAALMIVGGLAAGLFSGLMTALLMLGELAIQRFRRRYQLRGRHPWPAWLGMIAVLMALAVITPRLL